MSTWTKASHNLYTHLMYFTEPTTMLTDYLMAVFTAFFAYRLFKANEGQLTRRYWAWASVSTVAASVFAGTYHGFQAILPATAIFLLDKASSLSMVLISYFIMLSTAAATTRGSMKTWIGRAACLQAIVFTGVVLYFHSYAYAIADYAIALLVLLALSLSHRDRRVIPWFVAGVLLSIAAAVIQQSTIQFASWFNHNDIYHVIQLGAFYTFYRGGLVSKDRR